MISTRNWKMVRRLVYIHQRTATARIKYTYSHTIWIMRGWC